MAAPKAPSGYKLYARAWGKSERDHDVRVLQNRGYIIKVIKRREAPDARRPKSKMDRYYIFAKKT